MAYYFPWLLNGAEASIAFSDYTVTGTRAVVAPIVL